MQMQNKDEGKSPPVRNALAAPEPERASARAYRILIVDDHAVVRRGLRSLLASSQLDVEVAEASTGAEAVEQAKKFKPNLVVLDLTMPEMNGLEAAHAIHAESPSTAILVLTMHFSDDLAREVLRTGALGYMLKSDADVELLAAIEHARRQRPFFTGKLAATMAQNFLDGPQAGAARAAGDGAAPGAPLTPREVEVVQLLAEGNSNKQVAAALKVSTRTVESHRNHIMRKMNFSSFSELIRFAVRANFVNP
jgi:DNA-binding NarL/FixJ family response regulator